MSAHHSNVIQILNRFLPVANSCWRICFPVRRPAQSQQNNAKQRSSQARYSSVLMTLNKEIARSKQGVKNTFKRRLLDAMASDGF